MNILITGGCGFIGSNFIRYILEKHPEYKIVNLDALTYAGNLENLKDIKNNKNYKFIKGDIADYALVTRILSENKIENVLNFAAESHVDRSIQDPAPFITTNVLGTQILLHASKESDIKRYIQVSTDEVYGSADQNEYFTENSPLEPNSPYSASKASADLLVRSYWETYKFPAIITRCSNNYGPYQFPEKLIPLMITNALEDKPVPVYGDGLNVRDWIYVLDHCKSLDVVLHKGKDGEVYNIGGKSEMKNIDVVRLVLKEMKKSESLIQFVKDRPGHDRRYTIDSTKIEKELDWRCEHNFEEWIRETIKWYMNNEEWWRNIKSGEYLEYYKKQYNT